MIFFSLLGAAGVLLLLSGLPPLRREPLRRRVEPYLVGFGEGRTGWLAVIAGRLGMQEESEVRARLEAAGAAGDVPGYRLQQIAWAMSGVGIAASVAFALGATYGGFDPLALVVLAGLGGTIGYLARDRYLGRQVRARRELLMDELPTALDLLTLAIMSGESVPAALRRTAATAGGVIGVELEAVVGELRAGAPTLEALGSFSRRVPEPEVARLVDSLITAIVRGAPLAEVLRAQADDHREARRRRLLELGGRREVLMLVPVVFLILPVVVLFALYPGLVALDLLVP